MEVILAKTYGFCMGAKRAIEIAKRARKENDGSVNVLKEIVHNPYVVSSLKKMGIGSVHSLQKVKNGVIIFSAHGVAPDVVEETKNKGLKIVDATCPLVTHIHRLVKGLAKKGYTIILIGDRQHDEIIGISGESPKNIKIISKKEEIYNLTVDSSKVAVITQTTLSVDDSIEIISILKKKFPDIEVYNTICNATQSRQKAVKDLSEKVDLIIVIGSQKSANSKRLAQIARCCSKPSYLINDGKEISKKWFTNVKRVGITAGASTPDEIVEKVIKRVSLL